MKNEKRELTYVNLFLIVLGIIFFGELLLQIASRLGLEIPNLDYYLKLQFIVFTPLGIAAYLSTRAKVLKFISALLTVFSLYLISFSSLLVYTFDDPIAYFRENQKEVINAFTSNTLMLLPILIGFVVAEIANIFLPKILKEKKLKEVLFKVGNDAVKRAKDMANNSMKTAKEEIKPKSKAKDTQKTSKAKKTKNAYKKKRGRGKKTK